MLVGFSLLLSILQVYVRNYYRFNFEMADDTFEIKLSLIFFIKKKSGLKKIIAKLGSNQSSFSAVFGWLKIHMLEEA